MFWSSMQAGLLPSWFPAEMAFIALATLVIAVLALNKGDWWFINVLAIDEPLVVAVGVSMALGSSWLAGLVGGSRTLWMVVGAVVALLGLYAVQSERIDLDFIG